jgi:hypothetical protein
MNLEKDGDEEQEKTGKVAVSKKPANSVPQFFILFPCFHVEFIFSRSSSTSLLNRAISCTRVFCRSESLETMMEN